MGRNEYGKDSFLLLYDPLSSNNARWNNNNWTRADQRYRSIDSMVSRRFLS